jgi:DNA-binding winged helix-turn-helix (wHTH) protein/Flp pilus assembly protein TadD
MDTNAGRNHAETAANSGGPSACTFLGFILDTQRQLLVCGNDTLRLRPRTYDVLAYLAAHPGRLVSKHELMEAVWGEVAVTDDSLVQCLMEIRRALGPAQGAITTVRGRGYLLDTTVEWLDSAAHPSPPATLATATVEVADSTVGSTERPRLLQLRPHVAATAAIILSVVAIGWWWVDRGEPVAAPFRPVNPDAHEALLKGRYYWSKRTEETTRKAIGFFEQAIAHDPGEAMAFVGLSDAYLSLSLPEALQEAVPPNEAFPKARAAAERALAIDDRLGEAHASLGHIKFQYDRDWRGAEQEFKRAIELNPRYPYAHMTYALCLMWMGRLSEAIAEVVRARQLDPLFLPIGATYGFILARAGQYDRAIQECRKTLDMDSTFALAHYRLGQTYVLRGDYQDAISPLKQAVALSNGSPRAMAELGLANALAGNEKEARAIIESLEQRSKTRYVSPFNVALVYAGLGQKEQTFEWLQRAELERSPSLNFLILSPAFANVREDPRFTKMVEHIGLGPIR